MKAEEFIDDRLMRQIEASGVPQTIGIPAGRAPP
jgi:hypothetical protein